MVVFGLNQGMQPIAGYNFGAKQFDRVNTVMKLTILLATAVMTVGFLISEIFPHAVASAFTTDEDLINISCSGLTYCHDIFPYCRFSDGCLHFLSKYWDGRQSYIYVTNPTGTFPVTVPFDPALIFSG